MICDIIVCTRAGNIPSLYNMTSLRVVRFDENYLNGSLPNDFFNQLPKLENFTLYSNQFQGSIPQSIGNCSSLIFLGLAGNFFTGKLHLLLTHLLEIR